MSELAPIDEPIERQHMLDEERRCPRCGGEGCEECDREDEEICSECGEQPGVVRIGWPWVKHERWLCALCEEKQQSKGDDGPDPCEGYNEQ